MQVKKDQVRETIEAAALKVFAKKGYMDAKIADIAMEAGFSVGNIYRYYKTKDEIFYRVIPKNFPEEMQRAIIKKISAVRGGRPEAGALKMIMDEFIKFMLANRERITILLLGSRGTRYAHLREEFADALLPAVKNLYPEQYGRYLEKYKNIGALKKIYENLIGMHGAILGGDTSAQEAESQLKQVNLYHYSGITSLLEIF